MVISFPSVVIASPFVDAHDVTAPALWGTVGAIGCLLVIFALISPRLALFAIWLFSDLLSRAFESWVVPLLGFFFLPWTTLAYAVMWSSQNRVHGFEWFIVGLAFLLDLASHARSERERHARA
jgi:hypothetical protein